MAIKKSELYSSLWQSCDELRGGMDASQYKDYVLVLLFVKYVSDKYAGQKDAMVEIPKGGSFADMVALKGDKEIAELIRAFANLANELPEAGFTVEEIDALKTEVGQFEKVREEVKLASGDYIDLKMYEPAMRHLIDTYIRAEDSKKIASFDDIPLVQLIVERGADAVAALPKGIRDNREAAAETIENNVRRLIIDEQPLNPKYYDKMSELLDALIGQRKKEALNYQKYLEQIVALAKKVVNPASGESYPKEFDTPGKRALFDNLGKDQALALVVDRSIRENRQDDWRNNPFKIRKIRFAIKAALGNDEELTAKTLELVKNQNEY